jgi:hypothetical protein
MLIPLDWLHITARNISANSGDDIIAGTVHELGQNVLASGEFQVGDRVAAFHPMLSPGGAYAEYSVAPQSTVLKIPTSISFEGPLDIYPSINADFKQKLRRSLLSVPRRRYLCIYGSACPRHGLPVPLRHVLYPSLYMERLRPLARSQQSSQKHLIFIQLLLLVEEAKDT